MIFRDDLFKNKSVLVTGGGTGIGKEIAAQFLKAGATVFICGRKEAKLKAAIEELSLLGTCFEKTTDIRETAQILDLANFIKEKTGRLDILINNAGGQFLSPAEDITEKGWLAVINNNLTDSEPDISAAKNNKTKTENMSNASKNTSKNLSTTTKQLLKSY